MRNCEQCERPTSVTALSCERCYCEPGSTGEWLRQPAYSTKGLSIAAVIAVALATLMHVAADLLPPLLGPDLAEDSKTRDGAYALLVLLNVAAQAMIVVAGVLVIAWMWLTLRNHKYFPQPLHNMGPGWAVGAWVIPVANVFLPFRVMSQIAREDLNGRWARWAVAAWWTCFVGAQAIGVLVWQGVGVSPKPAASASWEIQREFYTNRLGAGLFSAILIAGAGYLLTVLIVGVTINQGQRISQARARRAGLTS